MNSKQQANAIHALNTKAAVDQFGRITYKNYSIEVWSQNKTFSIYNMFNSMYDTKDGFKSVDDAVQYIDRR
jgi:hypothetical protein